MTENRKKILLVEDEENLSSIIELNLQLEGYEVKCIAHGRKAIEFAPLVKDYDLVILDVMLPEVSGWDICETYKRVSSTPILFMSAKGASSDKIKGLKLGADDYLGKPFDLEELLLRVQILLQRGKVQSKEINDDKILNIGPHLVNLLTYEVTLQNGQTFELTKREVELLQLFYQHEGEVVSRNFILEQLWSNEATLPTTRTIDNYILAYRKFFEEDPKNPQLFHSIRGVGYKFTNITE